MPLYLCKPCGHEFEWSSKAEATCDWCGGKELKILAKQTEVEKMVEAICYPMGTKTKKEVMSMKAKVVESNTFLEESNYECDIEFMECENPNDINITIKDNDTGRTIDVFVSRDDLLAALNKTPDEPCCCGKMKCDENHQR